MRLLQDLAGLFVCCNIYLFRFMKTRLGCVASCFCALDQLERQP